MNGTFYIVGVGPGDPNLLTLLAVQVLKRCPVWLVPRAGGDRESTALKIAAKAVETRNHEIISHTFPMKKIHMDLAPEPEVIQAWQEAAKIVVHHLRTGRDVAFPTLGDPAVYSTGFYVHDTLRQLYPEIKARIIPGVSSMGASAAAAGLPLCQGDDRLMVLPATYENGMLRESLEQFDTVVLMKVHRSLERICHLLEEMGLLDRAVLVERTSQAGECVVHDLRAAATRPCHYFSTIIIKKENEISVCAGEGNG